MKMTVDLPAKLLREVKRRASREQQQSDKTLAELIAKGIAAESSQPNQPKPVRLKGGPVCIKEIEEAINWGRA